MKLNARKYDHFFNIVTLYNKVSFVSISKHELTANNTFTALINLNVNVNFNMY